MRNNQKGLDVAGWRTFDFTLMRDSADATIMVSDEIIRDYMSYIATCRQSNQRSLSFADWITATPADALRPTTRA
ncbi:MAG: hypothetical protein H6698_02825 [Myxococcales bacterium]|nr:hypothetical protein [Myxococcales bacterium]MCB9533248.1 hypothetical protein [Myxococcales bacterium]